MSKLSTTSRRAFLGNLAILSAGAAFGSVTTFFTQSAQSSDLINLWQSFYRQMGGETLGLVLPDKEDAIPCCPGHTHQSGTAVAFHHEGVTAQPTWIYWGRNQNHPSDLVVTFFDSQSGKKLFRLNRFELEGLQSLPTENRDQQLLKHLKESAGRKRSNEQGSSLVQTRIRKRGSEATIRTRYDSQEFTTQKKLISYT